MNHVEIVSQLEGTHLEQLPKLLDEAARADGHEPVGEHKFLRLRRGDDLAVAVLAYASGELAGYAHTVTFEERGRRRVSCEFVVHPDRRGGGIGKTLLGHAIQAAQQQGAHRLDVWAYNDSAASAHLAQSFGFRPSRRLLHLHRHTGDVPDALVVDGARVRGFVPGSDDEQWLALNNRIFAGHPENGAWRLDDLRARFEQPWFNADDLLMLEVGGVLRGFCWIKVEERANEGLVGEIYVIGTAPECRGMGLGRFLLATGMQRLRERGSTLAAIYVDDANRAAVSLYEAAGFHYHHVDVCYSIDVASARLPAAPVVEAAA